MEQQSSTSTVTVEYFDPHDVYKLLAPGLVPRLPLHNLHWQSHSGPLRSIDTLHVELVQGGNGALSAAVTPTPRQSASALQDDGFQTQHVGGSSEAAESTNSLALKVAGSQRRHQIPGIRRTPYLKLLLVRCDDNDVYKSSVRAEIREWVKTHTSPSGTSKKASSQENHDAFEWLIVHVVIPNTVASTQPRSSHKSESAATDKAATSRWRTGATPLMEKLRADFNASTKGSPDRIAQIRIGINDVPYDLLPRVVPAVPSGYTENEQDAENAWSELIGKLRSQILSSFDMRVTQYEEDIKERDAQRSLPGWNFCTFFMLKEGLARGFENVGLVEDALVGYDELNVGLDAVIHEQLETGSPEAHGGAMLSYTEELKVIVEKALAEVDDETVDMQSKEFKDGQFDEIPISSTKKAYRVMILENKVSVFDFRCYIFSRQIALLLRLGNAVSSKEELLAKLKRQQESILTGEAPLAPPPPSHKEEPENLSVFAEICQRTLQFIPSVSQILRRDIVSALLVKTPTGGATKLSPLMEDTVENMVASFAFSVAQQILAQTSTKALPIPPSTLSFGDGQEPKTSIPEPKTMMHPARSSSLFVRGGSAPRPPLSPGVFPGPGRQMQNEVQSHFIKAGLEDLAARRAELYMLSRTILTSLGKKRGWSNGWDEAPLVADDVDDMADVDLDDKDDSANEAAGSDSSSESEEAQRADYSPSISGIDSQILQTATDSIEDFYRLYEILTDKAMRHYTVANHDHAVHASMADLAVLKFHVKDYKAAASYFCLTTPFFGESGWTLLELSMLVMYAQCLDEMQSKVDYVSVALKLLTKSCAAERDRLREKVKFLRISRKQEFPNVSSIKGVVEKLCRLTKTLSSEVKVPLANFFTNIELAGLPEYNDSQDGCSLYVEIQSLLPEQIDLDSMKLRIISVDGGPGKERVFEKTGEGVINLAPGKNRVKLECNSVVAGRYKIDYLGLSCSNFLLHFARDISIPTTRASEIFKHADVVLFQRTSSLDITLAATKQTSLDKNNSLDLGISTGWNSITSCEVRVKPATGGLRFLTKEAKIVDSSVEFAKSPEAGVFCFGAIDTNTLVTLRFPYSVEQDVADVFAKVEATYVTESGETFYVAKSLTIPVSLALGVNVQDVFKHHSLFSRFNVSTASSSPLRLYKSELLKSDLFESAFGVAPSNTITIFPRQPASLLYRVKRKPEAKVAKPSAKTMYLKLHYSLLETEVEERIKVSLNAALETTPLKEYSKLIAASVLGEVRNRIQPRDLERAALTGEVTTSYLEDVSWENHFDGIGRPVGLEGDDGSTDLTGFLQNWLKNNSRISIPWASTSEPSSILIPVEIPSLSIVHTTDIRLQKPLPSPVDGQTGTPVVCTNQMLPATLHLKWTRIWDTESQQSNDQEFSYEVTAPADTWLLGGRRKGHFVIPGMSLSSPLEDMSSTTETEAEIPLVLIPLREGWLPYPTVEIREIVMAADPEVNQAGQGCEVDLRNLGETVKVVGNRSGVTVSLDASGPGGGHWCLRVRGWQGLRGGWLYDEDDGRDDGGGWWMVDE
ncbi:Trafficking particle complex subunit 10-like protein [Cladobotryum mycophilum]|uniref:Trafficking particle complex subunit 10-like protein n=1 Tax=Cladobotryum mycophilum TaxID=491253 RepID=A0ABR0SI22_9HYPO